MVYTKYLTIRPCITLWFCVKEWHPGMESGMPCKIDHITTELHDLADNV